jgi:hypothetical protein
LLAAALKVESKVRIRKWLEIPFGREYSGDDDVFLGFYTI